MQTLAQLGKYRAFIRQYGLSRCAKRAWHDWQRQHGYLKRRFPSYTWQQRPLGYWLRPDEPSDASQYRKRKECSAARFFFAPGQPPKHPWMRLATAEAENVLAGRFRYFFSDAVGDLGTPVNWFVNPFTGQRQGPERHWCDRNDFETDGGDIKYIWEPARFAWAYSLARAYAATGDDGYAEGFWSLFESFRDANPPNMGPNWQCGQEVAIRAMACVFALHVLWASPATTDQRVADMAAFLAGSAERIYTNIDYARWQMGNHAVSEAAGLYTIAVLFPEMRDAQRWRQFSHYVLEEEALQYIWADGSYVQHSTNYQRLMLHAYLWSMRLGQLNGESFSPRMQEKVALSYRMLYQLQDESGRVPNYGPNDGGLILPLNSCGYEDCRPVLGAIHYLFAGSLPYETGPWTENLLWLFGPEALEAAVEPLPRASHDFPVGGYYTFRNGSTWAMVRCHTYRNRPHQADMLHLDLWHEGCNVLRDSGTYSYYDPKHNWNSYFLSTAAHNTVVVGGVDQMIKGPRFRWYSLLESRCFGRVRHGSFEVWQGEHYGYRRLPSRAVHRRSLCLIGSRTWVIVDDVIGQGTESAELLWQLADVPVVDDGQALRLSLPDGPAQLLTFCSEGGAVRQIGCGLDNPNRMGWQALVYGRKSPAPTLSVASRSALPVRFITLLSLGGAVAAMHCDPVSRVAWRGPETGESAIELLPPRNQGRMIRSVQGPDGSVWTVPQME